jgi:hypothetical protein
MIFQEKLFENAGALRAQAVALADSAVAAARAGASSAAGRITPSLSALTAAGRELSQVARRHAGQIMKTNSSLAVAAGQDVAALIRQTYATLGKREAVKPASRSARASRKRARSKKA